jgi:hypothetical protein
MNSGRPQDLSAAFASLITMMLQAVRARGWRGLKDLPEMWRAVMYVRQQEKALADLMADFLAGKLPPPPPAPERAPWIDPAEWQATSAQSPAPPCPAARTDPAARARGQSAERPTLPVADGGPDRPRAADRVRFAGARSRARGRTAVWLRPPCRAVDPFAVFRLPTGIFATGRSPGAEPKNSVGSNCV